MLLEASLNSDDWGMFVDNFIKKCIPVTAFVINSVKNIHGTPRDIAEVGYQAVNVALSERADLPMLGCRRFYLGDTLLGEEDQLMDTPC